MHTCVCWFHFFFFGVCDVLQLLCCDVHHGLSLHHPASRWSQVGYEWQYNFVPSRRFREGGLEDLKLSRGGGGARVNTPIGAHAVAKLTKPISSDSLKVQVEPVVSYLHAKEKKTIQILEAMWHA